MISVCSEVVKDFKELNREREDICLHQLHAIMLERRGQKWIGRRERRGRKK